MIVLKKIVFFFSYPIIIIIELINYFLNIKFCEINVSRLGHATIYSEGYLIFKDNFNITEIKNFKIIFYFSKPIANKQIALMIKRKLNIYVPSIFFDYISKTLIYWNKEKFIFDFKYSLKDPKIINKFNELYKKPSFDFTKTEILLAKKQLYDFGIRENDKWICIHNRDSAFLNKKYPNKNWNYHSYRDFSVSDLKEAAEYFTKNGFHVFRMGSIQEQKFNSDNSKIIDYAFSQKKNDLLDIYLLANCAFYFGGESGPSDIAFYFKRPSFGINFPFSYLYMSRPHLSSIFIFKRIRDNNSNKLLNFNDLSHHALSEVIDLNDLKKKNLELLNNSSEQILKFAKEVLLEFQGELIENEKDLENQNKFWDNYYKYNPDNRHLKIHPKVSPGFLRDNLDLID